MNPRISARSAIAPVLAPVAAMAVPAEPFAIAAEELPGSILAADVAAPAKLPAGSLAPWAGWVVRAGGDGPALIGWPP